jgi:hypothetical protein
MSNIILKFYTLAELCAYLKTVLPHSYTINTLQNTLSAKLSELEVSIAVEKYNAFHYKKEEIT